MRKEWRTLCETIYDCGYRFPDGTAIIRFGDLFNVRLLYSLSHYYKFTTQIHKERGNFILPRKIQKLSK